MAEEYYADVFDSCSEESEESEEEKTVFSVKDEKVEDEGPQPVYRTNQQVNVAACRNSGAVQGADQAMPSQEESRES